MSNEKAFHISQGGPAQIRLLLFLGSFLMGRSCGTASMIIRLAKTIVVVGFLFTAQFKWFAQDKGTSTTQMGYSFFGFVKYYPLSIA